MRNFLEETRNIIKEQGNTVKDVAYIGNEKGERISWKRFMELADFDYEHDGPGEIMIRLDLIIILANGDWMTRNAGNCMEWWSYRHCAKIPSERKIMDVLDQPSFLRKER